MFYVNINCVCAAERRNKKFCVESISRQSVNHFWATLEKMLIHWEKKTKKKKNINTFRAIARKKYKKNESHHS